MGRLPDQRRYKRVMLSLSVRFMLADGTEHRGTLRDISAGGIAVDTPIKPQSASTVVVYVDSIGRAEGTVVRVDSRGFALSLHTTPHKREKLVEQLTALSNPEVLDGRELRRHERQEMEGSAALRLPSGETVACRILDLSISGVSLEIGARPDIGSEVLVGKMRGRIARHHDRGIAIEFRDMPRVRGSLSDQLSHRDTH